MTFPPLTPDNLPPVLAAAFLLMLAGYVLADWRAGRKWSREREHLLQEQTASEQQLELELSLMQQQVAEERETQQRLQASLHETEKHLAMARVSLQAAREHKTTQDQVNATQLERHQQLETMHRALEHEHIELKTTLARKQEHFEQQLALLNDNRQQLTHEFEHIAGRLFEEKGKVFREHSQNSLDSLLQPLREQIDRFQQRVNQVHDAAQQGNGQLNAEIRKVMDIGLKMSAEANNLATALKGDSQQRGAWGEAQLQRTLELGGLLRDDHYEVQSSFRDEQGRHKQTDYLIKLPDGKHLIIDSKVTLNAYERVVSATHPAQQQQALSEHVRAVRRHMDDLASKDYSALAGLHSPSFVLMFMPIEPAYIEAMKHDRELFEYGYRKNIILVSHTTLIPVLRTVSNLWMMERSQQETREISERAGDIYNQVCILAERLARLGNTLSAASNQYNSLVTALAGQQGLHGKVERFGQLSARANKKMPDLQARHLDFENNRLQLLVEQLPVEQDERRPQD